MIRRQLASRSGLALLSSWYYLGAVMLGGFASVAAVSRMLPAQEAGSWFTIQALAATIQLADLGTGYALTRQMAHASSLPTAGQPQTVIGSEFLELGHGPAGMAAVLRLTERMAWIATGAGVLLAAAIGLGYWLAAAGQLPGQADLLTAYALYAAAMVVQLRTRLLQACVEGIGSITQERFLAGSIYLGSQLMAMAVLVAGGGLPMMALALLAANTIGYGAFYRSLRGIGHGIGGPVPAIGHQIVPLLRRSLRIWATGLGSFLVVYTQVPMITLHLGAERVPAYLLAQKISASFANAIVIIATAQRVFFTKDLVERRPGAARRRLLLSTGAAALMAAGFALCFVLLAAPLIDWWTGSRNALGYGTALLLAIELFASTSTTVWGHFVLAAGRNPFLAATLAAGTITTLLLLVLPEQLGLAGAALAPLLAGLCTTYVSSMRHGFRLYGSLRAAHAA